MKNIVLIGMPGAGKSTMGVILAKTLRMKFIDADLIIQEQEGRLLQEIIDTEGVEEFLKTEERAILSLSCRNTVIATGGSVVFSERAMAHLKSGSVVVYLKIGFPEMEKRLGNIRTRGIVLHSGENLLDMYNERVPLYERYADITISCQGGHFERCVEKVVAKLRKTRANTGTGSPGPA